MRRRKRRLRLALPVLLLLAAGAAGVWVAFGRSDGSHRLPVATAGGPQLHGSEPVAAPTRPETQTPPGLSLVGPNAFTVKLKGGKPRSALVFDMKTGRVLYKHNPGQRLPIASLTKIMTALLVVHDTRPNEKAKITHAALDYSGSGVGVLPKGKMVPVKGLLAGLLLPSGNDAAIALADHVAGTEKRFVRMMNARAHELGLRCTHYVSSHGLQPANRSCATDLAVLARLAMKEPRIASIVRHPQLAVKFPIKSGHLFVNTTNPLLHLRYPGTIGLKTGSSDPAGHCFVGVVRRGRRELAVVLLHSPDSGAQAVQLLNAAFRAGRG